MFKFASHYIILKLDFERKICSIWRVILRQMMDEICNCFCTALLLGAQLGMDEISDVIRSQWWGDVLEDPSYGESFIWEPILCHGLIQCDSLRCNSYVGRNEKRNCICKPTCSGIHNLVSKFYQYRQSCFPVHRKRSYPIVDNHQSSAETEEHFDANIWTF